MSNIFVPESPRDLGLPKDTWLEGQRETVAAVLEAFFSGKKYVMLSAPTGSGKSLVAAAVQKMLARAGGGSGGKSIALTHTIHLQKQYVETLPDAKVVTGRGNHACELPDDDPARLGFSNLTAEDAPCAGGQGCSAGLNRRNGCGYYAQFWNAADSPMVTMNYAYAARIMQQEWFSTGERDVTTGKPHAIRNPFRRSLLVADECHLAERAIVEAAGLRLNVKLLGQLGVTLPSTYTRQRIQEGPRTVREYETTGVWVAWATGAVGVVATAMKQAAIDEDALKKKAEAGQNVVAELGQLRVHMKRLTALHASLMTLSLIAPLNYDEWSIRRDATAVGHVFGVTAQPIWGWTVAHSLLWQWFEKVLLMSATPGDPTIERIKLGIPEEQFAFIERPSAFPVANRPVFYWPIAKLNYHSKDSDWYDVARAIMHIATSGQWAQRKGLIHSGSKANARKLTSLLNALGGGTRFFTHGDEKGAGSAAIDRFRTSPEPLVLVTASFTTGLDLPYVIGWQVIAKVPYGSLSDEVTARRRAFKDVNGVDFGQKVYQSEAMNTVVQAAGRIVRARDDSGPTFILDGNYAMLHRLAWKPAFYAEAYRQLSLSL